jgi:hypothetical protein
MMGDATAWALKAGFQCRRKSGLHLEVSFALITTYLPGASWITKSSVNLVFAGNCIGEFSVSLFAAMNWLFIK